MSPLRPSPQRGRALKESRPKKGCGGGKQPWSHLLRPRLQGRRLLAAVAGAEGAAGGSRLCSAPSRLSRPSLFPDGEGRDRRYSADAAAVHRATRALAPSEPTHGKTFTLSNLSAHGSAPAPRDENTVGGPGLLPPSVADRSAPGRTGGAGHGGAPSAAPRASRVSRI